MLGSKALVIYCNLYDFTNTIIVEKTMFDVLTESVFWVNLFSVTLIK